MADEIADDEVGSVGGGDVGADGILSAGGDGVDADLRDHEGHELFGVEFAEGEGGVEVAHERVLLHFGGGRGLSGSHSCDRALHQRLEGRGRRVCDADHHVTGLDVCERAAGSSGEVEAEVRLEGALSEVVLEDVVAGCYACLVGDGGQAGQAVRARCHDGGVHV